MTAFRQSLHRYFFRLVLLLFITFCVHSLFWFPYGSQRLYGAIPENATFVSEHVRLAGRWQGMCTNPVLAGILGGFGVKTKDLEGFAGDRGTALLIDRLGGRNLMTAYSPALPGSGKPGWAFTSWGGGNLQWVRWGILSGLLKDFEKQRLASGRVVWSMRTDPRQPRQRLVLTAEEGQIIGCLGEEAEAAVQALAWRVQLRRAPLPELVERLTADPDASKAQDRIWLRDIRLSEGLSVPQFACELEFQGPTGLMGHGVGGFELPGIRPLNEGLNTARLRGVLKDAPDLLVAAPFGLIEPSVSSYIQSGERSATMAAGLYRAIDPEGSVALALLGGEHSGRIASFKVPTLVLVLRLKPGIDMRSLVGAALDELNAKHKVGLIPRYYDVGSGLVVTADATVESVYSMIEEGERPALFIKDDQLFVFSNRSALQRLLGLADDLKSYLPVTTAPVLTDESLLPAVTMPPPAWAAGLDSTGTVVYAWADLKAASLAARDALAVYTLATYAGEFKATRKGRKTVDSIRLWVQTLGQFDQCEIRLGTQRGVTELFFHLLRK